MKILHLEASPGWGGQEMRILREAEGMRERGRQVILGVMKGGTLIQKARDAGFLVYELSFQKTGWFSTFFRLLQIIRKHQIQIVNTHSSLDSWIGGIAARAAGVKIVRTRHLSGVIRSGLNSRLLYGKLADFVVTTCESIIPMICAQSGKDLQKCRSIATGVDPAKIAASQSEIAAFRKKWGIAEGELLVGTACFMRSWKGIGDFLLAANLLREEKNIRWIIIGGGHAETYKQKARELQLEGIVQFTGHLENPYPAIAALDLFALLSTANEGVSQAILQAAYLAKPLIATATGGLGEVCIPNQTGVQVEPFSPNQVARAILTLEKNRTLREELGKKAKELVLGRFTFQKTLEAMEQVYQTC